MSVDNKTVRVVVPASTANLGPGFDAVGMALQLYTTITMKRSDRTELRLHGEELDRLPKDKRNLLYEVAAFLFREAGQPVPELYMEVESDVPLTRGLGSSAAAIVGALAGANALAGEPFTQDDLFRFATAWEGHPDNVGASLFGGIVVAATPEKKGDRVPYVRLPVPSELRVLAVVPDYWLSTEKARRTLPSRYCKADAVFNVGRSSLLVAALAQGRLDLLAEAMQDRLHQPFRAPLVPGLAELLRDAPLHGALGAALSGAGPTVLFLYTGDEQKERLLRFAASVMERNGCTWRALPLLPDQRGCVIDVLPPGGS